MTIASRKRAANAAHNAAFRTAHPDHVWVLPDFDALFTDALRRNSDAPRVEITHVAFPAYEDWLAEWGWYVFERAVHPWNNTFSVVAKRRST